MSLAQAILVGIIGLLLGGIFFRRASGRSKVGPILERRDKAIEKTKEEVRKDVEKLERRREEVLRHPSVSDALNELIDKNEL